MSLSRLAAKCRACPFVDDCDHKEMEAYGLLSTHETMTPPSQYGTNPVRATGEIYVDVNKLVRTIAQEVQLPEFLLRGDHLRR